MDAHSLTADDFLALVGRSMRRIPGEYLERSVTGRRVLVTGAGGTIGGALARRVADLAPANLAILGHGEDGLHRLAMGLRDHPGRPRFTLHLADVRDRPRLSGIFANESPNLIVHAAAVKHVPISEAHPEEAIQTNVLGSANILAACFTACVRPDVVLISTDKAVSPHGIMGKTKRVAEMLFHEFGGERPEGGARPRVVRLGNVLGASGSVLRVFQRQLERREPITLTHPEIRRYFIHVREAVDLILASASLPFTPGLVNLLDMGYPVRIADLARRFARHLGRPEPEFLDVGLRPGDRMDEPLFHPWEEPIDSEIEGVRSGVMLRPRVRAWDAVGAMSDAIRAGHVDASVAVLDALVLAGVPA